jgi:hypothetical protein
MKWSARRQAQDAERQDAARLAELERDAFWERFGEQLAAQGIGVWLNGRYYPPADRP